MDSHITCTPLDLRIKVGKAEHPRIYDRVKAGESLVPIREVN